MGDLVCRFANQMFLADQLFRYVFLCQRGYVDALGARQDRGDDLFRVFGNQQEKRVRVRLFQYF